MKTILAATDNSLYARAAQSVIRQLPVARKPDLHLVAVTNLPVPMSELAIEEALMEEAREYQKKEVAQHVAEEAEALRPLCSSVHTDLRIGDPGTEIVAAAEHSHAELIVMGARGKSAVRRFLLGSVSEYVCHHAPCPVLIVRPDESQPDVPVAHPIRKILFAVDHSDISRSAVSTFAGFPLGNEVDVRIMTVQSTINPAHMDILQTMGGMWSNETQKHREFLDWAKRELEKATPNVEAEMVEGAQIAHEILVEAEEWKADLIVIGDRGRSALSRFFLGSVSTNILRHAHCSVWVHRLKG
jgi:nucleotide-binding universal stress UspA family protein